jgi:hypothetical protein
MIENHLRIQITQNLSYFSLKKLKLHNGKERKKKALINI